MKKSKFGLRLNRRQFLSVAGMVAVAPNILTGCATKTGARRPPPSERVTLGVVGWGMQGPWNTEAFLKLKDCQVVAACDLDKNHLLNNDNSAVKTINRHYGNNDCHAYHDFRDLMARDDIDAVMLAVPDHWHALVAMEAANHKKDIYGEKPLARTIVEQRTIVRAVERNERIWQTGSWQRSAVNFHKAAEIVRNGMIGAVTRVEVGLPSGQTDFTGTLPEWVKKWAQLPDNITDPAKIVPGTAAWKLAVSDPPTELDYDLWLGPSRTEPYIQLRQHMNWRWNYNTGGGTLLDWIGHHGDIAHWGLDFDRNGPSEIEGHGEFPAANALWNTCAKYRIELKYPKNIAMTIASGHDDIKTGTKWIGTDGWVRVDRGQFDASNEEWRDFTSLPEKLRKVKLYQSDNHHRNFIDCVKSRKPTITPVQTAHHSSIPGHLGLISMLVGRKLNWDVKSEQILGDSEASGLLSRPYRLPWRLA